MHIKQRKSTPVFYFILFLIFFKHKLLVTRSSSKKIKSAQAKNVTFAFYLLICLFSYIYFHAQGAG